MAQTPDSWRHLTAAAQGLQHGPAAGDRDPRTGDVTSFVGGEKHVDRGEFDGLTGVAQWGVRTERLDFSGGLVDGISGVQMGPAPRY